MNIIILISLSWPLIRTCLGQFAIASVGSAVASAGGVTAVAQLPGFGWQQQSNGFSQYNNNNYYSPQQQNMDSGWDNLQGTRERGRPPHNHAPHHNHRPQHSTGSPHSNGPPGWPQGWEWGANNHRNPPGFGQPHGSTNPPGWGMRLQDRPVWGMERPPPDRPGWGMEPSPPPDRPGFGMGPPLGRPGWGMGPSHHSGRPDFGMGPPPGRPGWEIGPANRPDWDIQRPFPDRPGWNPTPTSEQPPFNWMNERNNTEQSTPPNGNQPPTVRPAPTAQPTKDTLIMGNNQAPIVPPPTHKPTPTPPTNPPTPHSIGLSELRPIIFPSAPEYVDRFGQEFQSAPFDIRRRREVL